MCSPYRCTPEGTHSRPRSCSTSSNNDTGRGSTCSPCWCNLQSKDGRRLTTTCRMHTIADASSRKRNGKGDVAWMSRAVYCHAVISSHLSLTQQLEYSSLAI
jgi:hypothetical protein